MLFALLVNIADQNAPRGIVLNQHCPPSVTNLHAHMIVEESRFAEIH